MSDAVADTAPARFVPAPASGSAQARSTVRGVLALQLAANGVGLAVVLAYVGLLMGRPDGEDGRLNLVVFGAYLAVQIALLVPINLVLLSRAVAWVREGVQPTAVQRRLVLRLPLLETVPALVRVGRCGGDLRGHQRRHAQRHWHRHRRPGHVRRAVSAARGPLPSGLRPRSARSPTAARPARCVAADRPGVADRQRRATGGDRCGAAAR